MTIKEKLIDLLTDNLPRCGNLPHWDNPLQLSCDEQVERIADHLIAHGVTVQEWISVKDRLPEPFTSVLVYRQSFVTLPPYIKVDQMTLWNDDTQVWTDEVASWKNVTTHWMPLPQPPKGE